MYPLFRGSSYLLWVMSDNLSDCPTRGWHELGRKRPQCTGQQFVHERLLAFRGPLWKRNRSRTQAQLTDCPSAAIRRPGTGFEYHDEPPEVYKCMHDRWYQLLVTHNSSWRVCIRVCPLEKSWPGDPWWKGTLKKVCNLPKLSAGPAAVLKNSAVKRRKDHASILRTILGSHGSSRKGWSCEDIINSRQSQSKLFIFSSCQRASPFGFFIQGEERISELTEDITLNFAYIDPTYRLSVVVPTMNRRGGKMKPK